VIVVLVLMGWLVISGTRAILFDPPRPIAIRDYRIGRLGAGKEYR
jgi:hypothetical protein